MLFTGIVLLLMALEAFATPKNSHFSPQEIGFNLVENGTWSAEDPGLLEDWSPLDRRQQYKICKSTGTACPLNAIGCCSNGNCVFSGQKCCENGSPNNIIPADGQCCALPGKYCPAGSFCFTYHAYPTIQLCSTRGQAAPTVNQPPVTSTSEIITSSQPAPTSQVAVIWEVYTFTIYWYYFSWYYTYDIVISETTVASVEITTSAIVSVSATDSGAAQSSFHELSATIPKPTPADATSLPPLTSKPPPPASLETNESSSPTSSGTSEIVSSESNNASATPGTTSRAITTTSRTSSTSSTGTSTTASGSTSSSVAGGGTSISSLLQPSRIVNWMSAFLWLCTYIVFGN